MKAIRDNLSGIFVYGIFYLSFFGLFVYFVGFMSALKVLVLPLLVIAPIVAIIKSEKLATRFPRLHQLFCIAVFTGVALTVLVLLVRGYDPHKCAVDRNSYEYC